MADKIRLRVVTPSRLLLDEEVDEVTAPGALGEFGVLPNHIAFLTLLEPGEMTYKRDHTRRFLAIKGGYAEVLDNTMTVLADAAEYAGEIDVEEARRVAAQAESTMGASNPEEPQFMEAAAALRWARVQMTVANRRAGD